MLKQDTYPDTYRHPLPNGCHYDMVRVKPGLFVMGSEGEEAFDREKPEHPVQITKDFYMGVYPVTQAVWKVVMDGHNPSRFQGDDRPVEKVSWQDIVEGGQDEEVPEGFLPRLNRNYPVANSPLKNFAFRLPTEAEWEYAAKGGHHCAVKPDEEIPKAEDIYTLYSGSDQLKEVAWHRSNSHSETKTVGLKRPNELGLCDMSGNVYEWCMDRYSGTFYEECRKKGIVKDPLCMDDSTRSRVYRGGSWSRIPQACRVSIRSYWRPTDRVNGIGFRLVLAPV